MLTKKFSLRSFSEKEARERKAKSKLLPSILDSTQGLKFVFSRFWKLFKRNFQEKEGGYTVCGRTKVESIAGRQEKAEVSLGGGNLSRKRERERQIDRQRER